MHNTHWSGWKVQVFGFLFCWRKRADLRHSIGLLFSPLLESLKVDLQNKVIGFWLFPSLMFTAAG